MISKGSYRKSKLSQGCLSKHLLSIHIHSPEDDVQRQEQFGLLKKIYSMYPSVPTQLGVFRRTKERNTLIMKNFLIYLFTYKSIVSCSE